MAFWLYITAGIVLGVILRKLLRKWRTCPSQTMMDNKTVIVTGANCGVGKATAIGLARRNAKVILACRSFVSAQETALEIQQLTGNKSVIPKELNLASQTSIRQFSKQILAEESHIDVLINNAGVFCCPYSKTEDGLEMHIGVNHFGHFLLTSLLLSCLKKSAPSRIVNVSSVLYRVGTIPFHDINSEQSYNRFKAYCNSKLANCLFTRELSKRLEGTGVSVYAVHPGVVATQAARHIIPPSLSSKLYVLGIALGQRDAEEGAQSSIYCSVEPKLSDCSGQYYYECKERPWTSVALDDLAAENLWILSEKLTGTK